jgi:hypothetical protein
MPPERNIPSGTSDIRRSRTDSCRRLRKRSTIRAFAHPIELGIGAVERQFPILLDTDAPVFEDQPVSGEQLVHALEHRVLAGGAACCEYFRHHPMIRRCDDEAALEDPFDLRCK